MKPAFILASACLVALSVGLQTMKRDDPEGLGLPEPSKQAACNECAAHKEYLTDCVCTVTDVMGTFETDASRKLTTRSKFGSETAQTGADRLPEGWHWHCRPISSTG